jgi:hypothetical protein
MGFEYETRGRSAAGGSIPSLKLRRRVRIDASLQVTLRATWQSHMPGNIIFDIRPGPQFMFRAAQATIASPILGC